MALARIITRSHPCSRELALDLLARGYAVEIVSPDSIPDNIADLELRVDTGPGDQLIASVEARDGEHSASLEFVHHLKAPMVNFIRRPPEPGEAGHVPEEPVRFNAQPGIEDVELPVNAPQLPPKAVSPPAEILLDLEIDSGFDPGFDPEDGADLISPVDPLPLLPLEPPSPFATEATTIASPAIVDPAKNPQGRERSAGWRWRAALAFASMLLLALVLGFGLHRTGKASAPSSAAASAASTDVDLFSIPDPGKNSGRNQGQVAALAVSPPAIKSEGNSDHAPKALPVAKADAAVTRTSAARTGARISRRHADDLIARDTVIYLDERYKPAPKAKPANQFAGRHPSSHKHGVVAANTVTYLNKRPAPKGAKQDSGAKQPSNLN
jgi:hypothetical protein